MILILTFDISVCPVKAQQVAMPIKIAYDNIIDNQKYFRAASTRFKLIMLNEYEMGSKEFER